MARYSEKKRVSEQTKEEAQQMARATQRPGQSKEQTRLIAQGIQKGIDLYKKQQKERAREQDRRLKKERSDKASRVAEAEPPPEVVARRCSKLPWGLLLLSWLGLVGYLLVEWVL